MIATQNPEPKDILNVKTDIRDLTVKEFFVSCMLALWDEVDGFSGKRPVCTGLAGCAITKFSSCLGPSIDTLLAFAKSILITSDIGLPSRNKAAGCMVGIMCISNELYCIPH